MATVFDLAVSKLLREAVVLLKNDPRMHGATFPEFAIEMCKGGDRDMFGLPPEFFGRALKVVHEQIQIMKSDQQCNTTTSITNHKRSNSG